jgi:hypothetical protein
MAKWPAARRPARKLTHVLTNMFDGFSNSLLSCYPAAAATSLVTSYTTVASLPLTSAAAQLTGGPLPPHLRSSVVVAQCHEGKGPRRMVVRWPARPHKAGRCGLMRSHDPASPSPLHRRGGDDAPPLFLSTTARRRRPSGLLHHSVAAPPLLWSTTAQRHRSSPALRASLPLPLSSVTA